MSYRSRSSLEFSFSVVMQTMLIGLTLFHDQSQFVDAFQIAHHVSKSSNSAHQNQHLILRPIQFGILSIASPILKAVSLISRSSLGMTVNNDYGSNNYNSTSVEIDETRYRLWEDLRTEQVAAKEVSQRLLIWHSIDKAWTGFLFVVLIVGFVLNLFGYAYIPTGFQDGGGLRIGTLEEAQFQVEINKQAKQQRAFEREQARLGLQNDQVFQRSGDFL